MSKQNRRKLEQHHKKRTEEARNRLLDRREDAIKNPKKYFCGATAIIDQTLKEL